MIRSINPLHSTQSESTYYINSVPHTHIHYNITHVPPHIQCGALYESFMTINLAARQRIRSTYTIARGCVHSVGRPKSGGHRNRIPCPSLPDRIAMRCTHGLQVIFHVSSSVAESRTPLPVYTQSARTFFASPSTSAHSHT